MLRFLKEDPLEIVLCFPIGDEEQDGGEGLEDATEAQREVKPMRRRSGVRMSVSMEDVLGSSPSVALGDDDITGADQGPSSAVHDSAVWLQQSMTGSSTDVQSVLRHSGGRPKLVRSNNSCSGRAQLVQCCCPWNRLGISYVSSLLHRGAAIVLMLRGGGGSTVADEASVHGRISLKRPLRSALGSAADIQDGCVLSYTNFTTGLALTTPLRRVTTLALTSPSTPVCFDFPDETDEYVVSSAAMKVVCFPSDLSQGDLYLAVLFRCGRVGCLTLSGADGEVKPMALSARGSSRPAFVDMAHVPGSTWCAVLTVTTGGAGDAVDVQLVVVDVPSASVLLHQTVPFGSGAAVAVACTPSAVTGRKATTDGLEDSVKAFHIYVAASERRVLHRYVVEMERDTSYDDPSSPLVVNGMWRATSCVEIAELQVNVEQSYFADSNVELGAENNAPPASQTSLSTDKASAASRSENDIEIIAASWETEALLSVRQGRIGHPTERLLDVCAFLAHQAPLAVVLAESCRLVQPQLLDARKSVLTSQLRYQNEGLLLVLWPQCVMVVDPSFHEGSNVIAVIERRAENVYFEGCWTTTHRSMPLVHIQQHDGTVLVYQLGRRQVDSHSAAHSSYPIDVVELLHETVIAESVVIPILHPSTTAVAAATVLGCDLLSNGALAPDGVLHTLGRCDVRIPIEDSRVSSENASGGASLRIVEVGEGHTQMLMAVFASGMVSCSPIGGSVDEYQVFRQAEPVATVFAPSNFSSSSAIASAALLRMDDAALHLVTGHRDGTVEVWIREEGRCVCLASLDMLHTHAVENVQAPIHGGSAFLHEHVGFLSCSPQAGTVVLHSKKARHFAPLRRMSTPHEPLHRIIWDTAIDLVVLEGLTTGISNFWFAHTGKLERVVRATETQAFIASPRIGLLQVRVRAPLSTSATQAAACVCEYTSVSFVDRHSNVLQTSLTPLIARVHAEVTAYMQVAERDRYRFESSSSMSSMQVAERDRYRFESSSSMSSPSGAASPLSVRIFSPRVALALYHCFAIPDIAGTTPASPSTPSSEGNDVGSPFMILCAKLLLPKHVHPAPRRLHIERLLRRSGAQTTRTFIFLLSLLRVLEPLVGRGVVKACVNYLLTHLADLSDASKTTSPRLPPGASPTVQGTPTSGGLAPLALPCVATCVPYVLHPLIAVQESAHATMSAVVQRLSPAATIALLQQPPTTSSQVNSVTDIDAADQRCLGRVVLAVHATRDPLRMSDELNHVIKEVAAELEAHIMAWATNHTTTAATAAAAEAPISSSPSTHDAAHRSQKRPVNQPVVLSVFADAWLAWQGVFPDHGDALIDVIFGRCVANTTDCPEYRYNHGARGLVDIAGQDFSRFINCVERWFARTEWRTQLLQLLTRVVQKYPATMLSAFPTAILHFAWLAIDPHAPHRATREQWVMAVSNLLRASVNVLPNIAFHQALQYLIAGHDDGQVFVYDVKSTRVVSCFQSHTAPIACVAFHAGSTQDIAVMSAALDVVRFWRMGRSHSIMGLHRATREQWVMAVSNLLRASVNVLPNIAFHQALQYLIAGHDDGQVFVYDVKSTRVVSCFQSHTAPIACVAFHAGSTQDIAVMSAALDVVRFWRMGRSHSIMGLLSIGGSNCHVCGAVDVPVTRAMRRALDALPNKCMTPEMIAASCRLSWLSPSCVELHTPWHDRIQLIVQQ
ncbi:Hypothetical protein, putative [Bodo saltans]|uniref:DUF7051 domain-containing protein n=1 Tax=Bodo saltans TaxID=75058 RepID=A0A0S4JEC3_BODSA|nr:Hypothetical protein, putative [Bodo saltans]|eukprot:CUG87519.1 Hypothetical protein, putative [Bodo saltans]